MPIKTVEIICRPCPKCDEIKQKIEQIIRELEKQYKIKIVYEFSHTSNLQTANKYSVNIAKTPIVVINGKVELAGLITLDMLRTKIINIHKY